jgi:hypothetical protein
MNIPPMATRLHRAVGHRRERGQPAAVLPLLRTPGPSACGACPRPTARRFTSAGPRDSGAPGTDTHAGRQRGHTDTKLTGDAIKHQQRPSWRGMTVSLR